MVPRRGMMVDVTLEDGVIRPGVLIAPDESYENSGLYEVEVFGTASHLMVIYPEGVGPGTWAQQQPIPSRPGTYLR